MAARKAKALPADASLVQRIEETVGALELGPADSGTVGLALLLAGTIDGMDDETRGRMLGQTAGALLRTLVELRSRSTVPAVTNMYPPGTNLLEVGRRRRRSG